MKITYYYQAMDACMCAISDEIDVKRSSAENYRNSEMYKDPETGEQKEWAKENALECDKVADEMEKILRDKFGV